MSTKETPKLNPKNWVDKYSDYLFNYAIARVNDREMAKDLVAETFMAGLQSKEKFKGNAAEKTWLVAILKHKIIDFYRKKNSQKGKAEVRMHYVNKDHEYDNEVICKELGITTSNLWVSIHRAKKQLAECLGNNWF